MPKKHSPFWDGCFLGFHGRKHNARRSSQSFHLFGRLRPHPTPAPDGSAGGAGHDGHLRPRHAPERPVLLRTPHSGRRPAHPSHRVDRLRLRAAPPGAPADLLARPGKPGAHPPLRHHAPAPERVLPAKCAGNRANLPAVPHRAGAGICKGQRGAVQERHHAGAV